MLAYEQSRDSHNVIAQSLIWLLERFAAARVWSIPIGYLLSIGLPASHAAITISGNVSPAYNTTDPWVVPTTLNIGDTDNGSINVDSASVVNNVYGYLGHSIGTIGTATITGAGSEWSNSKDLYVGYSGTGIVNIENGAKLINPIGRLGYHSQGVGTVNVTGSGSHWESSTIRIGENGVGTLNILSGASVAGWYGVIGSDLSSADIIGAGSTWSMQYDLSIDSGNGTGKLNIESGGAVNDSNGWVGYSKYSIGIATVKGEGSEWNNTKQLYIGFSGQGTLNIEEGAIARSASGIVGYGPFSTGSVATVTGQGSAWLNSGWFWVGNSGTGLLKILDGGMVTNTYGTVAPGTEPGSVIVKGVGSAWYNSEGLTVGSTAQGTLRIEDGGYVFSALGKIGASYGTGMVTVTGGESIWNNTGILDIGVHSHGSLNIEDGGAVYISRRVKLAVFGGVTGEINLLGGLLSLGGADLIKGEGTCVFNFIGGELLDAGSINLGQPFVQQGGTLAPGGPIGQTDILSDYDLTAGTVEIELGGVGNPIDLVTATGDIDISILGTTLDLRALGSMAAGTYTVLESTGGNITGMFENVSLLNLFGVNVTVLNTGTAITVTLDSDLVFADPNTDGFVGIADLNIVLGNWNQNVTPGDILAGDLNGDGFVGIEDLNAVLGNWNAGTPPPPPDISAAIPEPGTASILALSALWNVRRKRTRLS